jgi:hypothetical protein
MPRSLASISSQFRRFSRCRAAGSPRDCLRDGNGFPSLRRRGQNRRGGVDWRPDGRDGTGNFQGIAFAKVGIFIHDLFRTSSLISLFRKPDSPSSLRDRILLLVGGSMRLFQRFRWNRVCSTGQNGSGRKFSAATGHDRLRERANSPRMPPHPTICILSTDDQTGRPLVEANH